MIDLYTWNTPNGRKISVALEEMGLPYKVHTVNISKNEQFEPSFLAISPNNRIPAIVDPDGPGGAPISVFESGAILLYLAEKTGKFMPKDPRGKVAVTEWLMWQMGGFG
ncbi:MAG: glutathione S-transferase, partial [Roseomonas sp.]|nr:glutathione S-transferase [Roseomonas sp.]